MLMRDDVMKQEEETHEKLLYYSKKRTYICNRFGQGRHVGQNKCPCAVRRRIPERMRSTKKRKRM